MIRSRRTSFTVALAGLALGLAACSDERPAPPPPTPQLEQALETTARDFPEARKRKVVLLGFDSCDPHLVDRMIREGKLPNFARLKTEGTHGKLRSIPPYLSPIVWTTISTGMPMARHGITDFMTTQGGVQVPITSDQRQADTIWELLSRNGEEVGVVGWLVSYPAEPLPTGFLVTERVGRLAFEYGAQKVDRDDGRKTYPAALYDELRQDSVHVRDIPWGRIRAFADVEQSAVEGEIPEEFKGGALLGNLRLAMATAETFRNAGLRLHRERDPRFFACYFEALDVLSHLFMRYAPPRMSNVEEDIYLRYRTAIQANYEWHDRVLGEFMEQCDEDTTLVLVSDHGFKSGKFRLDDPSEFHARTGAQWHREYGSFFAWGNGVKKGHRIDGASVFDVAPTLLAAMGYPVPQDMPGSVLDDVFEDGLGVVPVATYYGDSRRRRLAAAFSALGAEGDVEISDEQREETERLKALGYIDGDGAEVASGQWNVANVMMARGQFEEARKQFEALLKEQLALMKQVDEKGRPKGGPTPRHYFALAEVNLRLGKLDESEAYVGEAIALNDAYASHVAQLRALGQATDEAQSPEEIRAAVVPSVLTLQTKIALAREEPEKALSFARRLRELEPRRPSSHVLYATVQEILAKKGRNAGDDVAAQRAVDALEEAIDGMDRAIELEPDLFHALKESARLRLWGQEWRPLDDAATLRLLETSRERLEDAQELFPRSPDGRNNYVITLLRLGMLMRSLERVDEARSWLEQARAVADKTTVDLPSYKKGWANRAYVYWQLGDLDTAYASALRVFEMDESYPFAVGLLEAFRKAGKTLRIEPRESAPENAPPPGK